MQISHLALSLSPPLFISSVITEETLLSFSPTVSLPLSNFQGNDKISSALSKLVLIYDLYFHSKRDVDVCGGGGGGQTNKWVCNSSVLDIWQYRIQGKIMKRKIDKNNLTLSTIT